MDGCLVSSLLPDLKRQSDVSLEGEILRGRIGEGGCEEAGLPCFRLSTLPSNGRMLPFPGITIPNCLQFP